MKLLTICFNYCKIKLMFFFPFFQPQHHSYVKPACSNVEAMGVCLGEVKLQLGKRLHEIHIVKSYVIQYLVFSTNFSKKVS